jgi:hypothetical protein
MAIRIRRQAGRPSALQSLIEEALYNVAEDLIQWQRTNNRVASGRSQDWRIITQRFGNNKPKDIFGELIGVRYVNYALFGRGAGVAPRAAVIARWMRQRGIKARDIQSGRFKDIEQAAHAIAYSIGKFGTQAIALSEPLQDAILTENINNSIDKYLPEMAEETADQLTESFVANLGDLKNITVYSS